MIPFEEIDSRLEKIGKDRAWLADVTGRKINSIRTSLAPNADAKNRSTFLQKSLSEAIEAEEARQEAAINDLRSQKLMIELDVDQFNRLNAAASAKGMLIMDWISYVLHEEARKEFRPPKTAVDRQNVIPIDAHKDEQKSEGFGKAAEKPDGHSAGDKGTTEDSPPYGKENKESADGKASASGSAQPPPKGESQKESA